MRILAWLTALFIITPLLELLLLIEVGRRIGSGATIAAVILTALVGAALARSQGFFVMRRIQTDLSRGTIPALHLMDGAMILIAGVLLLTPGLLTDGIGFFLLLPIGRSLIRHWLQYRLTAWLTGGAGPRRPGPEPRTVVIRTLPGDRDGRGPRFAGDTEDESGGDAGGDASREPDQPPHPPGPGRV